MTKALATQTSVIRALILREIRTGYGARRYFSLIWILLQPVIHIGIFWILFTVLRRHLPSGMPLPLFLLSGVFPYMLFSGLATKCMAAIETGRVLLYHKQVTPIDLVLAKAILHAASMGVVLLILITVSALLGYEVNIADGLEIAAGILLTIVLGTGVGLMLASWSIVFPVLGTIVKPLFRILYFTSGVFFTVESVPPIIRDELLYNPVMHLVDKVRGGFFVTYVPSHTSFEYAAWFSFIVFALGLVCEKMNRKKLIV